MMGSERTEKYLGNQNQHNYGLSGREEEEATKMTPEFLDMEIDDGYHSLKKTDPKSCLREKMMSVVWSEVPSKHLVICQVDRWMNRLEIY